MNVLQLPWAWTTTLVRTAAHSLAGAHQLSLVQAHVKSGALGSIISDHSRRVYTRINNLTDLGAIRWFR